MTHKVKQRRLEGGWTLVELLIVLGIIAFGLAVIAVVGHSTTSSSQASDQLRIIDSMGGSLKKIFGPANNFSGLNTTKAITLGPVVPPKMVNGGTIYNAWNGTVTIAAAADVNGVANRGALITWNGVPKDACSSLATGTTTADRVRVGATIIQQTGQQPNVIAAGTACSAGSNTVDFLFDKN